MVGFLIDTEGSMECFMHDILDLSRVPTTAQQMAIGLYERCMFEEAVQTRIHLSVMSTFLIYFLP